MNILAIYRHYWPDTTPYAHLLRAILQEQVKQGRQVEVFCAQPSYNDVYSAKRPAREVIDGVSVRRVTLLPEKKHLRLLRAVNSAYFLFRAVVHCVLFKKCDLIIANSHPPVLMGFTLRIIKRLTATPFLLHCQDVHPEGAVLAGDVKFKWCENLCKVLDHQSCTAALRVVTLSDDMKQTLLQRGPLREDKLLVLNNFTLHEADSETRAGSSAEMGEGNFRLIFAGNMGRYQALQGLLWAIHILQKEIPLECLFLGAGEQRCDLQKLASRLQLEQVRFEPFQSVDVAFAKMQRADLGITSLGRHVYRIAYPSKTMTYVAAGCPVFCIVEKESQIAREIIANQLGYVPASLSPADIAEALRVAWRDRKQWTMRARRELVARGDRLFGKAHMLRCWNAVFHEIAQTIHEQPKPTQPNDQQLYRRAG